LLLFLPVSFEKKKSNKIPAVLDAEDGVNFCREVDRSSFAGRKSRQPPGFPILYIYKLTS
jgi:hypothetical protein